MPMLMALADVGACSITEAMSLPVRVLTRMGELLSDRRQREQEAEARARGRARSRG